MPCETTERPMANTSPDDWYASLSEYEKEAVHIVFGGDRRAAHKAHQAFAQWNAQREKETVASCA